MNVINEKQNSQHVQYIVQVHTANSQTLVSCRDILNISSSSLHSVFITISISLSIIPEGIICMNINCCEIVRAVNDIKQQQKNEN